MLLSYIPLIRTRTQTRTYKPYTNITQYATVVYKLEALRWMNVHGDAYVCTKCSRGRVSNTGCLGVLHPHGTTVRVLFPLFHTQSARHTAVDAILCVNQEPWDTLGDIWSISEKCQKHLQKLHHTIVGDVTFQYTHPPHRTATQWPYAHQQPRAHIKYKQNALSTIHGATFNRVS